MNFALIKKKGFLKFFLTLGLIFGVLLLVPGVDVEANELDELTQKLKEAEQKKQEIIGRIQAIDDKINSISASTQNLYSRLYNLNAQKLNIDNEVNKLNAEILSQEKLISQLNIILEAKRLELLDLTNFVHKTSFLNPNPLFSPRMDIQTLRVQQAKADAAMEVLSRMMEDYRAQIQAVNQAKISNEESKKVAEETKISLETEIVSLQTQIQSAETSLAVANQNKGALFEESSSIDGQIGLLSARQKELLEAELARMAQNQQGNQQEIQSGEYFFTGRGRDVYEGHGLGMSQYGAYGMALQGWTYDQILRFYYTGVEIGDYAEPEKVILYDRIVDGYGTISTQVNPNDLRQITGLNTVFTKYLAPSTEIYIDGNTYVVETVIDDFNATLTIPVEIKYENINYTQMDTMPFAEYMAGIGEVPNNWPVESVKAQVVAARTYVMGTCGAERICPICSTSSCQVYVGGDGKKEIAETTKGKVILYNGEPIIAYYSASHRGHSSNLASVWGGQDLPYIQPVNDDPYAYKDYTVCDPYQVNENNNGYTSCTPEYRVEPYYWNWRTNGYTLKEIGEILAKSPATNVGELQKLEVVKDSSGRASRVILTGSNGQKSVTGWDFRAIFNAKTTYSDYIYSTEFDFYKK